MNYFVRLRELREEKELTQQEVADIIKINRVQYNQYENDYNTIPLKHLIKLCDYFDVMCLVLLIQDNILILIKI